MNMNSHSSHRPARGGFTLVELLVVISIIALLVAIMLPSLGRARQLAFRAGCASNLREIAHGCLAYANEGRVNRGKPGSLPATDVTNVGDFTTAAGNSACLWLLVRNEFCGRKVFLCPEAEVRLGQQVAPTGAYGDNFENSKYCSYGYISMKQQAAPNDWRDQTTITLLGSATVIAADRNPRWTSGDSLSGSDTLNSKNHSGEGQNVAVIGGSVRFVDEPIVDGDAIYVRGDSGTSSSTIRADLNDNLIVP